jgi:hypothetical protein
VRMRPRVRRPLHAFGRSAHHRRRRSGGDPLRVGLGLRGLPEPVHGWVVLHARAVSVAAVVRHVRRLQHRALHRRKLAHRDAMAVMVPIGWLRWLEHGRMRRAHWRVLPHFGD